mmetsp:Transcript_25352/g.84011  ORF Transcript_25352/g.84011 Transcript_25352/m.84011 type:complete len:244 (+) Transcript_25352:76-807(+)
MRLVAVMVASVAALQPPKALQAILFDIDGTLFDSDPVHLRAFQKILVEEGFNGGVEIDEAFFMKTISGRQNKLICRDIFPEWDEARSEAFSARKEQMFRDMSKGSLVPIDGLIDFMGEIDRRGLRKAAVTNAPRLNAESMLDGIERREWFDALVIGDECVRAKPDPEPYLVAAQALGVEIAQCVVVEDSPSGASAGAAAGAFVVGMLSSQTPEALTAAGCAALVRDYRELGALLALEPAGQAS